MIVTETWSRAGLEHPRAPKACDGGQRWRARRTDRASGWCDCTWMVCAELVKRLTTGPGMKFCPPDPPPFLASKRSRHSPATGKSAHGRSVVLQTTTPFSLSTGLGRPSTHGQTVRIAAHRYLGTSPISAYRRKLRLAFLAQTVPGGDPFPGDLRDRLAALSMKRQASPSRTRASQSKISALSWRGDDKSAGTVR